MIQTCKHSFNESNMLAQISVSGSCKTKRW